MIREHLVKALYKQLMGPENGPTEIVEQPFLKYEMGILNTSYGLDENKSIEQLLDVETKIKPADIKNEVILKAKSENTQESDNIRQEVDSELNLKIGAFSLGLSFIIEGIHPKFEVCLTWARYIRRKEFGSLKIFQREPYYHIEQIDVKNSPKDPILINNECADKSFIDEKFLHVICKKLEDSDKYIVKVFFENKSYDKSQKNNKSQETSQIQTEEVRIFQPQIRIIMEDSKLADLHHGGKNMGLENQDDLMYHNLRTKARGFLCAAVWKEIDPEQHDEGEIRNLLWPDYESVPKKIRERFINPDVRTEYLPLYSILQPDQSEHLIDANLLSEIWDNADIEKTLRPIATRYAEWTVKQKSDLGIKSKKISQALSDIANENITSCNESVNRINAGIDFIQNNYKARAAFCFMNAVMNDKRTNEYHENLKWREFQLAFILQTIKGVSGESKDEQKLADVLWFPTGGGKTEAYLGLVIFAIAYRRLQTHEKINYDGGTAVISRYTLRLLTIQQFQRALGAIVAADIRRVENWMPKNAFQGTEKDSNSELYTKFKNGNIWGNQRISLGLWIGTGITPKDFACVIAEKGSRILNCEGALLPYTHAWRNNSKMTGEPTQVTNCPICNQILCIPETTKKEKKPISITWIINTTKSLNELKSIPKQKFEQQNNISLQDVPKVEIISKSYTKTYYRLTMEIRPKQRLDRKTIDEWWKYFVKPNLIQSEGDEPLESTSPSTPGYFFLQEEGVERPHDFAIFCTNGNCKLNKTIWFETFENNINSLIPLPFKTKNEQSKSVPISAFISDEQVYSRLPSFIIATVDKFANLPFEPRCASIFGNVDVFHSVYGYGRQTCYASPIRQRNKNLRMAIPLDELHRVNRFSPPSLILQDELHLIEGTLGSMVGIYESAVDILSEINGIRPKYIASSATIKESDTQVGTVFRREVKIFPNPGISYFDNHFSKMNEDVSCINSKSGRLYMGITTSKSTVYLPIKAQSIIMSEIFKIRNHPQDYNLTDDEIKNIDDKTDPYWTFISYFTDLQLLSKFTGYYSENIIENVEKNSRKLIMNSNTIAKPQPFSPGLRLFPIISDRDMAVHSISIFCANKSNKIEVAVYKNNDLLFEIGEKNCKMGETIFDLKDHVFDIKKNEKIWIAISNNNETYFQCVECNENSLILKHDNNMTSTFPKKIDNAKSILDHNIKISINSSARSIVENNIELSSETKSEDLSNYLEQLNEQFKIDSLQTSPVFGTGIDVERLGIMQVMNQPKTNSGYIQSTGRVGRTQPGLIINWLRAGRARDLDHYENFIGYHRMLHSFVEPVTASPFSDETMRLCIGPIIVAILRNAKDILQTPVSRSWASDDGPPYMSTHGNDPEILSMRKQLENIVGSDFIPKFRKMDLNKFVRIFEMKKDYWKKTAADLINDDEHIFSYDERNPLKLPRKNVVLGTPNHEIMGLDTIYENTPNSFRQTESTATFYGVGRNIFQIRPSQYITRYGPGTLISGKTYTMVMPSHQELVYMLENQGSFARSDMQGKTKLLKYEIHDSRMKRILKRYDTNDSDIRMFSLPTNSSLSVEEFKTLYKCKLFPKWGICYSSLHPFEKILAEIIPDRYLGAIVNCPLCKENSKDEYDEKKVEFYSSRFVLACKKGHMGDVNWPYEVHESSKNKCNGQIFEYSESGNSDDFDIICKKCRMRTSYLTLKYKSKHGMLDCTSCFAETETVDSNVCTRIENKSMARLTSKTQMSIRMPFVITTMEIPKYSGRLFKLYEPIIKEIIAWVMNYKRESKEWNRTEFIKFLEYAKDDIHYITNKVIRETKNAEDAYFKSVIESILRSNKNEKDGHGVTEYDALAEELSSLEEQTLDHGSAVQVDPNDQTPSDIRFPIKFSIDSKLYFEVMPFSNINVTQVQLGYTREISPPTDKTDEELNNMNGSRIGDVVSYSEVFVENNGQTKWHIGNQLLGEGIFIHLNPKEHNTATDIFQNKNSDVLKTWHEINKKTIKKNEIKIKFLKNKDKKEQQIDSLKFENIQTNPIFIWWHSFAHELINQLSIDSGFMGVSLGERVYCIQKTNNSFSAGIFIYTSSPGSDGTLGGLISLVNNEALPRIVANTLKKMQSCSNDPICYERKINFQRKTGAACHICLMNSETSCSYQNRFLDRNIVDGEYD